MEETQSVEVYAEGGKVVFETQTVKVIFSPEDAIEMANKFLRAAEACGARFVVKFPLPPAEE